MILSEPAAVALGVDGDSWDAAEYAAYLDAVTAARDEWDASAPLDAVEYALSS